MRRLSGSSRISRRDLVMTAGAAAICATSAFGQKAAVRTIGVVRVNPQDVNETFVEPFRRYMKELGWEEGNNIEIQTLWAGARNERIPALVDDLIGRQVDILVLFGDLGIRAGQRATASTPIVGLADDLVRSGLASSMARPGGNTTGVSLLSGELDSKRLELLHEFVPAAKRIGVLADPTTASSGSQLDGAARSLGIGPTSWQAQNRDEIARALDAMSLARIEAVNVLASPILNNNRDLIIPRLRGMRLPAIYQWPESAEDGGLLGYGPRLVLAYRQMATLVDKILRGARPADLPIEQPTTFELVVNLRTANAIGLAIPPALQLRADRVIE